MDWSWHQSQQTIYLYSGFGLSGGHEFEWRWHEEKASVNDEEFIPDALMESARQELTSLFEENIEDDFHSDPLIDAVPVEEIQNISDMEEDVEPDVCEDSTHTEQAAQFIGDGLLPLPLCPPVAASFLIQQGRMTHVSYKFADHPECSDRNAKSLHSIGDGLLPLPHLPPRYVAPQRQATCFSYGAGLTSGLHL